MYVLIDKEIVYFRLNESGFMEIREKVVVISGASSGIGKSLEIMNFLAPKLVVNMFYKGTFHLFLIIPLTKNYI
jgi:hypothetical protein